MRSRKLLFIAFVLIFTLSACNLGSNDEPDESPISTDSSDPSIDAGGVPVIVITSPNNGDEVVVNEPVLIRVTATDAVGVTQVRMFVDDQIARTVSSTTSGGETQGSFVLDYTPRSTGEIVVRVEALRNTTVSEPVEISLNVRNSQTQVTATASGGTGPIIDPNDPTCRALVLTGLNFRRGPSTDYDVIRVLGESELLQVVGRLSNNTWVELLSGTSRGWVSQDFVTLYGSNCSSISISVPPASPTPQNQATATFTPVPTNTPIPQPTNTTVPQAPNLSAPSIGVDDVITIPSGESEVTETIGVTISNSGGTFNEQFSNTVRIRLDGGSATTLDLGVVSGLGAGESINLSIEHTFDAPGEYEIRVRVDVDGAITESNETDNIGTVIIQVVAE